LAAKKARGERLGNPNIGNRILHAVMKARDIGLEGFNAPADLNALHVAARRPQGDHSSQEGPGVCRLAGGGGSHERTRLWKTA
jgi:hypothetical protein